MSDDDEADDDDDDKRETMMVMMLIENKSDMSIICQGLLRFQNVNTGNGKETPYPKNAFWDVI